MQKSKSILLMFFCVLFPIFVSVINVNALSATLFKETSYRTQILNESDEFLGIEMENPNRINLDSDINFENYDQNEILKEELYSDELLYHNDYPIYESYDYKYIDKEATIQKKGLQLIDGSELDVNGSLNTEIEDLGNHKNVLYLKHALGLYSNQYFASTNRIVIEFWAKATSNETVFRLGFLSTSPLIMRLFDNKVIINYEGTSSSFYFNYMSHFLFDIVNTTSKFSFYLNGTKLLTDKSFTGYETFDTFWRLRFGGYAYTTSDLWIDALCMYEYNEAIYPQGLFRNLEMFLNYTNNIEMEQSETYGWNGRKFYSSANEEGIYFINMSKALNIEFYLHANATPSNFRFGISQLSPLSYRSATVATYAELFQVFQIEDKEILCNSSVITYNYSEQLKINLECLFESNVVKLYVNDSYVNQMDALITNFNLPNFFYIYDNTNNNNYLEITDLRIYRNSTVNYFDKYEVDYVDYDLEQKKVLVIETNATANDFDYELYANYYKRIIYNFSNSIMVDNLQENQQRYEIWLDSFTGLFRYSFESLSLGIYRLGIFNLTEWNYEINYIDLAYSERIVLNFGFLTSNDLYTDSEAILFLNIFDKNALQLMNLTLANNSFSYQQDLRCKFISYQNSSIMFNIYAIDSNYFLKYEEVDSIDLAYFAVNEEYSFLRIYDKYYVEERSYQLFDNSVLNPQLIYKQNEQYSSDLIGNWVQSYTDLVNSTEITKNRRISLFALNLSNAIHSFEHSFHSGMPDSISGLTFSILDENTEFSIRIGSYSAYTVKFKLVSWFELSKDATYLTLKYFGSLNYRDYNTTLMQIQLSEIKENVLDEFQLMFNFINDKDMNIRLSLGNRVLGAKLYGYDNIYIGFLAKYGTLGATWDLVEQTFVHKVLLIENSDSLMLHSFVSKLHFEDIAYSSVNLDGIFYSNNFVRLNPIIAVYDEFEGNEWMYYRDNLIFIPEIDSFFPLNYDIQSYFLQKIRINYRIQMNVSDEYFTHYVMLEVGNLDLTENITLTELYNKTNPYFQFIAEIQYTDLNYTDIIIEYEFVEYWVISYNIEELTFGSFIRSIIVPTILIVIFAICGYVLLKVKGVIYSLEISFIILYVIKRMSFISLILLSIFELIFVIYNINQKGVKVE